VDLVDYILTVCAMLDLFFTIGIVVLLFKQQKQIERLLLRPLVIQRDNETQHLLSVIPGHINVGGGIELHQAYPSYMKYRGLAIEVQVVARNQHEMMRDPGT
jgi:hypothetical protein